MEVNVLLWFLGLCSAPVLSLGPERVLWYEPTPRTWEEARDFCRRKYGDLATVETSSDIADLKKMNLSDFHAWIGLKEVNSSWHWQDEDQEYDFQHVFTEGQPESGHECGKIIYSHRQVDTDDCEQKHFFFCQRPTNYSHIRFVDKTKPWAEALKHCESNDRQMIDFHSLSSESLDSIFSPQDFPVWTGLHYNGNAWGWSDGTQFEHKNWAKGADPSSRSGSCATVYSSAKQWTSVRDCSDSFPFVCQQNMEVVLKRELLSWEEGLEACSNISSSYGSYSLLSVQGHHVDYVLSHATGATSKVWVGLRFLAGSWFWSDGAPLLLPSLPPCPDPDLRCGALVRSTGSIEPADCSQALNVLCYGPYVGETGIPAGV